MAVWEIDPSGSVTDPDAALEAGELWHHYSDSGLIYADKLAEIAPVLPEILGSWPRTFTASEDVYLFSTFRRNGELTSSLCRARDTDHLLLLQHAASLRDPVGMIACILAAGHWYDTPGRTAGTLGWFYRAENAWPARIVNTVSSTMPATAVSILHRSLLTLRPRQLRHRPPVAGSVALTSTEWSPAVAQAVDGLVSAVHGTLRAHAYCLSVDSDAFMRECQQAFAAEGLERSRQLFIARRDGGVAGVAVRYVTGTPVSLSRLDQRVEILVHPESPDRNDVVADLVAAVSAAAMDSSTPLLVVLDEADVPAAVAAGCRDLERAYADVVWDLRSAEASHRARSAVLGLYDRVAATADRRRQRASVAPTGGSDEVAA